MVNKNNKEERTQRWDKPPSPKSKSSLNLCIRVPSQSQVKQANAVKSQVKSQVIQTSPSQVSSQVIAGSSLKQVIANVLRPLRKGAYDETWLKM